MVPPGNGLQEEGVPPPGEEPHLLAALAARDWPLAEDIVAVLRAKAPEANDDAVVEEEDDADEEAAAPAEASKFSQNASP